jgi:hypothetical protein
MNKNIIEEIIAIIDFQMSICAMDASNNVEWSMPMMWITLKNIKNEVKRLNDEATK